MSIIHCQKWDLKAEEDRFRPNLVLWHPAPYCCTSKKVPSTPYLSRDRRTWLWESNKRLFRWDLTDFSQRTCRKVEGSSLAGTDSRNRQQHSRVNWTQRSAEWRSGKGERKASENACCRSSMAELQIHRTECSVWMTSSRYALCCAWYSSYSLCSKTNLCWWWRPLKKESNNDLKQTSFHFALPKTEFWRPREADFAQK